MNLERPHEILAEKKIPRDKHGNVLGEWVLAEKVGAMIGVPGEKLKAAPRSVRRLLARAYKARIAGQIEKSRRLTGEAYDAWHR